MRNRAWNIAFIPLCLTACGQSQPELAGLQTRIKQLEAKQSDQAEYILRIEENVALRACGPALKEMLERIRSECRAKLASASGAAPAAATAASPAPPTPPAAVATPLIVPVTCASKQTNAAVFAAARAMGKSVGETLQASFPHEVVYLDAGQTTVPDHRKPYLDALAKGAWLQSMRFVLISAPKPNEVEANRRMDVVRTYLESKNIEPWRFEPKSWVTDLTIPKAKLKGRERPEPPEPENPSLAVWVFRTDC